MHALATIRNSSMKKGARGWLILVGLYTSVTCSFFIFHLKNINKNNQFQLFSKMTLKPFILGLSKSSKNYQLFFKIFQIS
jgi:hypothetical protein